MSDLSETMARDLAASSADLDDERAVILWLGQCGHRWGDIVVVMDQAIERARVIRAQANVVHFGGGA